MLRIFSLTLLLMTAIPVFCQQEITQQEYQGTFTDERDAQVYKWVKIGSQIWMAENLNYGKNRYNCYKGLTANCDVYGKIYPWKKAKKACPLGWHIPDDSEWVILTDYLGGESNAGGKMKDVSTDYWEAPNAGATNSSGFCALPGGFRNEVGECHFKGQAAYFWTSSEADIFYKWVRLIINGESSVSRTTLNFKNSLSIRCLKD
jgi:uncharacterized protein (TIGR02145 family)